MRRLCLLLIFVFAPLAVSRDPMDYKALDQYIKIWVDDSGLTGLTVAIVKEDKVVFSQAYGFADLDKREKLSTEHLFNIASCSKAMSTACLAMLVEEGRIRWNDRVTNYIAGFQLQDPWITQTLTIEDILNHRSGLATFAGDLLWYGTNYSSNEILYRMRHIPLSQEFRSDYGYQNNTYLLADRIILAVTGTDWSQFLTERLLVPLNMNQSRPSGQEILPGQKLAYPHYKRQRIPLSMRAPFPGGSIFSNVEEMTNWMRMLLNKGVWEGRQILKPATVETLFTPQTIMEVSPFWRSNGIHLKCYGMGWNLYDYAGSLVADHGGGMPGYISKIALIPEKEIGFIILTNDMNYVADGLKYKILDLLLEEKPGKDWIKEFSQFSRNNEALVASRQAERYSQRAKNTQPSLDLIGYTGTYEDAMYGKARIELLNGSLVLTLLPARTVFTSTMEHWHYDTFRIRFRDIFLPEGFVTFRLTSGGTVEGFTIDLPNADLHFDDLNFLKLSRE